MKEKTEQQKSKAGRKKIDDKKVPITIYRNQSEIDRLGGRVEVRNKLNNLLNNN